MLPDWYLRIPPGPDLPRIINVIVEIPKGRRCKFEVDKTTGLFKLDRYLYSSSMYPGDYGFIPQSLAEDGDPLDVLVMVNEPTFTGCLIEARPLGLFKMTDKGDNDFKVLAVPADDPIFSEYDDLWRVPPHFLREVEHFFATYKQLEGTVVEAQGWDSAVSAKAEIHKCIDRYQKASDAEKADAVPKSKPRSTKRTRVSKATSKTTKAAKKPARRRTKKT
ncbi:MAG: inorganic diphosphatase [Phycisphaeraceae bacterium]